MNGEKELFVCIVEMWAKRLQLLDGPQRCRMWTWQKTIETNIAIDNKNNQSSNNNNKLIIIFAYARRLLNSYQLFSMCEWIVLYVYMVFVFFLLVVAHDIGLPKYHSLNLWCSAECLRVCLCVYVCSYRQTNKNDDNAIVNKQQSEKTTTRYNECELP